MEDCIGVQGRALGILHPVITVSDLDKAVRFYCDVLGLTVRADFLHEPSQLAPLLRTPNPDVRAAVLDCPDGSEIELAEFRSPSGRKTVEKAFADAGITWITFLVDDIDAVCRRVEDAGYTLHGPVVVYHASDGSCRVVYCYGPDGHGITFVELPSSDGQ